MKNDVLDKLILWKIRLVFLEMANSDKLGLNGSQRTKDTWPLGLSPIFKVRKLTKNSTHLIDFLG